MAYTREQIGQALKAAHEAGDVEAARALAVAYRDWKPATPDPVMNRASERANMAFRANEKIAPADLNTLGRLDFSPAAMGKLPAPTMSEPELDAWTAERMDAQERMRLPDDNNKERMIAALNGPTFGNGPRIAAGAQTVGALLATPFVEGDIIDQKGISGASSQFLDDARIHQRRGRDERPIESMALEIVPALFQGKTIVDTLGKKFIPGTTMASNVGRFSGVGGLYGALYGASQSEKGNLGGVAEDAAVGGALGAGFGLGMKALQPAATAGVRSAKTAGASLYDALAGALGKAGGARDRVAEDVAVAAVRRSMERSGLTFDEIMGLVKKYEGKPAVLAEVIGQDAVNALTALTRRPGSTPQKAQAIQEERVFARPERMIGDVEDATGIAVGQLDDTLAKQLEERQAAAKPIYDALYKRFSKIEAFRQPGQTGQVMKRINRLARTPLAQRHLQLAKDAVATIAARRGIPVSKMSTMEYWDLVKRSLDDAINSAQSKGEARTRVGEGIDDLVGLKADLVDELDRLTGGAYAAAREVGGEAPRLKAAAASGQKVMQARNPREVAKTVAATAPQDLPALRAGVVEDLGTRINKGMLPSRVRVPDIANKLRASLGEKSANKLINRLDAEASLAETGARWAPRLNSVTGTVMENGATQMGDDLINAGFNLATGNKLGLFRQAINFMRQRGFSQRQIDAIGDLLLSSPEEGLRRLKVMTPDGLPAGAAAPLAGAASGGGLPPSGGMPMQATSPAAGPIRSSGLGAGLRSDIAPGAVGGFIGFNQDQEPITADNIGTKARNALIGVGVGVAANRIPVRTGQARNALADTATAGMGKPRTPQQAARFETPGSPEWEAAKAKGLDMSQAGRMARAKELGYDTETVLYHGTQKDFDAFVPSENGAYGPGIYFATEPRTASAYATSANDLRQRAMSDNAKVISVYPKKGQYASSNKLDDLAAEIRKNDSAMSEDASYVAAVKRLQEGGFIGVRDRQKGYISIFDPSNIRSVNAAFDPDKAASPILTAGIGGGGRGPRKPSGGGNRSAELGKRAADIAAIGTLANAPPAEAQTSGTSAELQVANQRVESATARVQKIEKTDIPRLEADLRLLEDLNADPKAIQTLLDRRGFDLGPRGIDGKIGTDTNKAIADNISAIKGEISLQRAELDKARKEETSARDGVKRAKMADALKQAEPNPYVDMGTKAGSAAAFVAGTWLAYRLRKNAVKAYEPIAKNAARKANALLNEGPLKTGKSAPKTGPNSLNTRAANINEFWKQGGAKKNVPFEVDGQGTWSARPGVKEPSQLFKPAIYRSGDLKFMASAGVEAGAAKFGADHFRDEAQKAEADMEKALKAGDDIAYLDAVNRRKSAKATEGAFRVLERLGYGALAGRGLSGLVRYPAVRANIAKADSERSVLLQGMAKQPKPNPTANKN